MRWINVGIAASLMSAGCGWTRDLPVEDGDRDAGPAIAQVTLDDVPRWVFDTALTLGRNPSGHTAFAQPVPLGTDDDGRLYVLDIGVGDIRRFDAVGRLLETFVPRGSGPGEMRARPGSYGLTTEGVWFSEIPTGRVHYVPFEGDPTVDDTGWSPLRRGVDLVQPHPVGPASRRESGTALTEISWTS